MCFVTFFEINFARPKRLRAEVNDSWTRCTSSSQHEDGTNITFSGFAMRCFFSFFQWHEADLSIILHQFAFWTDWAPDVTFIYAHNKTLIVWESLKLRVWSGSIRLTMTILPSLISLTNLVSLPSHFWTWTSLSPSMVTVDWKGKDRNAFKEWGGKWEHWDTAKYFTEVSGCQILQPKQRDTKFDQNNTFKKKQLFTLGD